MREWVEEFAALCDANSSEKSGCSEQQLKFIDKWSKQLNGPIIDFPKRLRKPKDNLQGELTRLKGRAQRNLTHLSCSKDWLTRMEAP